MIYRFLILLALTGCATPYQQAGMRGGYEDFEVQPGVHYVSVKGNGYTSRSTIIQYWHRRAAEICGGDGRYEMVSQSDLSRHDYTISNSGDHPTLSKTTKEGMEGYVRCVNLAK